MHHLSIYNIVIKIGTEAREICAIYEEGKFSLNTCRKLGFYRLFPVTVSLNYYGKSIRGKFQKWQLIYEHSFNIITMKG